MGLLEVAIVVDRRSRCTIKEMPRMTVVDAVKSFTRSLIILYAVSLVLLISSVLTGGCRVLGVENDAAQG